MDLNTEKVIIRRDAQFLELQEKKAVSYPKVVLESTNDEVNWMPPRKSALAWFSIRRLVNQKTIPARMRTMNVVNVRSSTK